MQGITNRRGFTLIEILLVLAIIGAIVGAIWLGYGTAVRYSRNEIQEKQIADLLQMSRDYLQQFNENNTSPTSVYDAAMAKDITLNFITLNLLPASVKGAIVPPLATQYGTATISTFPSAQNPYNSGPLIMITLGGFDQTACIDTLNTWGGSPDRIAQSGMVAVVPNTAVNSSGDITANNELTKSADLTIAGTSLSTAGVQNACPVDNAMDTVSLIFRLNP